MAGPSTRQLEQSRQSEYLSRQKTGRNQKRSEGTKKRKATASLLDRGTQNGLTERSISHRLTDMDARTPSSCCVDTELSTEYLGTLQKPVGQSPKLGSGRDSSEQGVRAEMVNRLMLA